MPINDLSEEEKDRTLAWLESNVLHHPTVGKKVKRLLKEVDSRVQFPEIDLEDAVEAKTKEQEEKLNKFFADQKDKENKAYWAEERKKAQSEGLVKEDERGDFEKWMIDEHLGNYQRAAKMWHEEKHAAAEPTNYNERTNFSLPNEDGLFANPVGWARNTALKSINELRRGGR